MDKNRLHVRNSWTIIHLNEGHPMAFIQAHIEPAVPLLKEESKWL